MESKQQPKDNKRKRTLPSTPSMTTRSSSRKLSNSSPDPTKPSNGARPPPRIKLVISKPNKQQPKQRLTRSHTQAQSKSSRNSSRRVKASSDPDPTPPSSSSDAVCPKKSPNKSASFAPAVTQFDEDESMLYSDHENQSDIEDLSDFDDDDLEIEAQSPNKRPKIEHLSFMPMESSKDFYQLTHPSDNQSNDDNDGSNLSEAEAEEEEEEEEDMPHFHYESRYNGSKTEGEEEDPYFVSDLEDESHTKPTVAFKKALPQQPCLEPQHGPASDSVQLSRNPSLSPLDYYSFSDSVESSVSSPRDFDDLMSLEEPLDFVTGEDELDSNLPSLTPLNFLKQDALKASDPLDLHHGQELSKRLMNIPSHFPNAPSQAQEPVSGADEIAQRWSQASQRERSNSFSTLINRQSFKRFARVLAKRPHLAASLNDTLSISSVNEETPKDIEASLDQFFDLIDESMVQASTTSGSKQRSSESSESSSSWTTEHYNKVPLCGYRNRNHTIKVPGGAHLNAKKILAALASISSDNEKLVASFPDSNTLLPASSAIAPTTSPTSTGSTLSVESSLSTSELYSDIYPLSLTGTQASTANHSPTINDVMTPISFTCTTTNTNVLPPLGMQSLESSNATLTPPASSDSVTEISAEITKSALEYYQQAVVAATGLNLRSLYSGKARETITGEAPVSSVF